MKKILLIVLVIMVSSASVITNASTTYPQSELYKYSEKLDIVSCDIDLDGDLDMVTVGDGYDIMVWHENNGSGNFTNSYSFFFSESKLDGLGQGDSAARLINADFDNDGDQDIIAVFYHASKIYYFENFKINDGVTNDTVTFADPTVDSVVQSYIGDLGLLDVDSDGFLDLVVSSRGRIAWFENKLDSSEGFNTQLNIFYDVSTMDDLIDMEIVDIDNDGDKDIVYLRDDSNTLNYIINNGGSTFTTPTTITTFSNNVKMLDSEDINNDGYPDLLVSLSGTSSYVKLYKSTGAATWSMTSLSSLDSYGYENYATFIDLDQDSDYDIVASYKSGHYGYLNNGSGSISSPNSVLYISYEGLYKTADINGDGKTDIYNKSWNQSAAYYYLNEYESGSSYSFEINTVGENGGRPSSVYIEDLDNDGFNDIVQFGSLGELSWSKNNGDGTFETIMKDILSASSITIKTPLGLVDFNDDSLVDVFGNKSTGVFSWAENLGDGTYSTPIDIRSVSIEDYEIYDIDSDGDNDVITTGYNTTDTILHLNNGDNTFTDIIVSYNGAKEITLIDVDNDEDLDIICHHSIQQKISWYENQFDENGTIGSEAIILETPGKYIYAATISNLNNDQFEDMVVAGTDLFTLTNDGDGTFTYELVQASVGIALMLEAVDYDRDSDVDIIFSKNNETSWFENDSGSFSKNIITTSSLDALIGDVDNNSIYELIVFGETSGIYAYMTTITSTVQLDDLSEPTNLIDVNNTVYGQPMPSSSQGVDNSPDHHSFAGYYSQADGQGTKYYDENMDSAFNWDKKTGAVLYAYYEPNQYTITFEENGGEELSDITDVYGANITIAESTKSGMGFDGWYTDSSLTTEFTSTTMPGGNTTLYAKWVQLYESIPLVKTLHLELPTEITTRVGEEIDIPVNAYSLYGYYKDDMTSNVVVTGTYDINKVGQYELTYTLNSEDLSKSETIVIKVVDIEAPVLSFDRPDEVYRNRYYEYIITATDNYDGDVEVALEVEELTYSVMVTATAVDSSGNTTTQKYEIPLTIAKKIVIPIIIDKHQKILIFDESELDLETIELLYQWNYERPETDSEWWLKYENFIQIEHGDLFIKAVDAEGSSKIIEIDTTYLPVYEEEVEIEEPVAEEIEEEAEVEEEIEEPETTPEVVEEESSLSLGVVLASIGSVAALAVIMYRFKK